MDSIFNMTSQKRLSKTKRNSNKTNKLIHSINEYLDTRNTN